MWTLTTPDLRKDQVHTQNHQENTTQNTRFRTDELKVNHENVEMYRKELKTLDLCEWDEMARKIQATAAQKIFLAKKINHAWWNNKCEEVLYKRSKAWNR